MSRRAWSGMPIFLLLLGLSCAGSNAPAMAAVDAAPGAAAETPAPGAEAGEADTASAAAPRSAIGAASGSAAGEAAEPAVAEAPPERAARGGQTGDDRRAELDAIADLLIDGRPAAAKAAAEALLAADGLQPPIAARARQLLAKAEELLPPPAPPLPPFPAASFDVLRAQVGGGFSAGTAGSLRFSEDGVSFRERGRSEPAWTLEWDRVLGLDRDGGLWDTRHPLVLRERDRSPRYFALVDSDGNGLPPDRLLTAFERARREAAARRTASASGGSGGSPGKEPKR